MIGYPPGDGRQNVSPAAGAPDWQYLTVALRAWPGTDGRRPPTPARRVYPPRRLLVVDTETTTDVRQALTFGSARLGRLIKQGNRYVWHQETEVLFHADDLPETDPDGYRVLCDYAQREHIELLSRAEFVEQYIWRYCYRRVGERTRRYYATATVVFFNAPFDLSRLAEAVGIARGDNTGMAGGFSFRLWPLVVNPAKREREENRYRPRAQIKHLDSKKAVIRFGGVVGEPRLDSAENEPIKETHHGHFLDVRTLIWALTNESVSLKRGCETFNVEHGKYETERHGSITSEYVDYNRRDVLATAELAANVLSEFFRHPVRPATNQSVLARVDR